MNQTMTFPETIEEFIELYKFKDSEEVYTNGSELIQVYRVKQWIDAHPVKHGRWIDVNGDGSLWQCSLCGEQDCCKGNYCMDCGAKMDAFAKDTDVPDKNVGKMDEVSE